MRALTISRLRPLIRLRSLIAPTLVACSLVTGGGAATLCAEVPRLLFDMPLTAECHDLTTPEFAQLNPHLKMIGVEFHCSLLLERGRADDVRELLLKIESPQRRLKVVEYWPQTSLVSDIAGPIEISTVNETCQNNELGLGTTLSMPVAIGQLSVSPKVLQSQKQSESVRRTFDQLPTPTAAVTSGTLAQGHGVFFKFRHWPQATLEGARQVRCMLVVPQEWRGDWVEVKCVAQLSEQSLLGTTNHQELLSRLPVGLYMAGDAEAQQAAEAIGPALSAASQMSRSAKRSPLDPSRAMGEVRLVVQRAGKIFSGDSSAATAQDPADAKASSSRQTAARNDPVGVALAGLRQFSAQ